MTVPNEIDALLIKTSGDYGRTLELWRSTSGDVEAMPSEWAMMQTALDLHKAKVGQDAFNRQLFESGFFFRLPILAAAQLQRDMIARLLARVDTLEKQRNG